MFWGHCLWFIELFTGTDTCNGAEISYTFGEIFRFKRAFILSPMDTTVSTFNWNVLLFISASIIINISFASLSLLHIHRRCFKREFTEAVAIRMWEACWSNYLTDYFHLFLCLAIIAVYADDVVAQDLRTDEMLLHFSSLGMS